MPFRRCPIGVPGFIVELRESRVDAWKFRLLFERFPKRREGLAIVLSIQLRSNGEQGPRRGTRSRRFELFKGRFELFSRFQLFKGGARPARIAKTGALPFLRRYWGVPKLLLRFRGFRSCRIGVLRFETSRLVPRVKCKRLAQRSYGFRRAPRFLFRQPKQKPRSRQIGPLPHHTPALPEVEVRWPSGKVRIERPRFVDQVFTVVEPN